MISDLQMNLVGEPMLTVIEIFLFSSILFNLYSYLLYPIFLFCLSQIKSKSSIEVRDDYMPKVSILFAALNEADIIEDKIENFIELDYPENQKQIIFGSDNSDDNTVEFARKYQAGCNLKIFDFKERRGKIGVLNDIAEAADGEILIFTDANTIFEKSAIKELVKYFSNENIGCVCGKLILKNPPSNTNLESFYWRYENWIKKQESKFHALIGATGGIYAIRRELFSKFPDDKLIMDDFWQPLNIARQGFAIVYNEHALAYEFASSFLKDEITRKVRIGNANYNLIPKILDLLSPTKGMIAFNLWSHKIIRWFVPFFMIIALFSNIFIAVNTGSTFSILLLGAQITFYLFAVLGFFIKLSPLKLFSYLCATNYALIIGFWRSLTKYNQKSWTRVER